MIRNKTAIAAWSSINASANQTNPAWFKTKNILKSENRISLYEKTIKFINLRVELDISSFKEDIWSH